MKIIKNENNMNKLMKDIEGKKDYAVIYGNVKAILKDFVVKNTTFKGSDI